MGNSYSRPRCLAGEPDTPGLSALNLHLRRENFLNFFMDKVANLRAQISSCAADSTFTVPCTVFYQFEPVTVPCLYKVIGHLEPSGSLQLQSHLNYVKRLTEIETSYQEKLQEEKSALKEKDEELKSVRDRLTEIETSYQEKLQEEKSALKEKDEELKSVRDRLTDIETSYQEKLQEEKIAEELTVPLKQEKKTTNIQVSETAAETETFYKKQLEDTRAALSKKEEELKSFKDRVAAEVAVSIKTGDSECINSPVSKKKLTERYQQLKLIQWPKIKDSLKSNKVTPEFTKTLIQNQFTDSTEEMWKKKKQIEDVFSLIEFNSGLTPQKVKQYLQLANQNLQISLYSSSKEDLKAPVLKDEAQYSQDVVKELRLLASECYWLGCLMALNNPPLQLDWQNHTPGMDPWDILPRDIKSSYTM